MIVAREGAATDRRGTRRKIYAEKPGRFARRISRYFGKGDGWADHVSQLSRSRRGNGTDGFSPNPNRIPPGKLRKFPSSNQTFRSCYSD